MLVTVSCAFTVDGLRTRDEDLANWQSMISDDFKHLGGSEAVDEDILCHLRHVATICGLMKNDVDIR